jgi:Mg-chelatase subunit ChlD
VAQQTRIDLAVEAAHGELVSPRASPASQPVMIVLTDGRANPVGPEAAVARAAEAKAAGIVVFTVGLGDTLDVEALRHMASRPGYFYQAPDGEDLAEIYSEIAVEIPCPPGAFWGRR